MVLKIAHRGFSAIAPENSLEAFRNVVKLKVDMVEFDIHKTKDNHIVVIHDDNVERTTNGKGNINDLTLGEIRNLHIKNGEPIPTLEEVIAVLKNHCGMNIEIKDEALSIPVVNIIKKE
ncbi:MAG: glycerophosphodiester phosphodiesterase family protein, partial [Nanoarchaeota archaeon]|nr:glycerophosphodiester phosphodiesterase family protein [Nanoarchaeota archaeon]